METSKDLSVGESLVKVGIKSLFPLFLFMKLSGVVNWPWIYVFMPIIVIHGLLFLCLLFLTLIVWFVPKETIEEENLKVKW